MTCEVTLIGTRIATRRQVRRVLRNIWFEITCCWGQFVFTLNTTQEGAERLHIAGSNFDGDEWYY